MRKILLYSSALVVLSGVANAACIQTPSCSSLGYSSSSSCTGGTKCPFGNYWNCTGPNNTNKITELTNKITTLETKVNELSKDAATANCKIGDILYSDMSCNANVVITKTPIGVIFDTTNRLAIGLKVSKKSWSTEKFDIPGLSNITSSTAAIADWQGKRNTQIVLEYCKANGKNCPAFEYVNSYKTEGTQAGDWYLPARGELNAMVNNIDTINKSLRKVGGRTIEASHDYDNIYFSSSSPKSKEDVWALYSFLDTVSVPTRVLYGGGYYISKSNSYYCIPVLAF